MVQYSDVYTCSVFKDAVLFRAVMAFCDATPQTYNDIPCVVDKCAESFLVDNGVDPALAYHVAHLFAR